MINTFRAEHPRKTPTLSAVTKTFESKPLSGQTIVVTGGAGFIGSHLCDRLVQRAWHVICVDNLYTGKFDNIRPLLNHPNFEFLEHDIAEPLAIAGPVHKIYNLACAASPRHYQRDPIGTMRASAVKAVFACGFFCASTLPTGRAMSSAKPGTLSAQCSLLVWTARNASLMLLRSCSPRLRRRTPPP